LGRWYVCCAACAGSGWLHTAPRYHQLMPISCHFHDCEALLFVLTTCKQRYIKYPGFFTFLSTLDTMGVGRDIMRDIDVI